MNLGWDTEKWRKFFEVIGFISSAWRKIKETLEIFSDSAIRVDEYLDVKNQLSEWVLKGVNYGVNTDDDGIIYARLTGTDSTYTVSLFKDSSKNIMVATGSRSGNGLIELVPVNFSGLSGFVTVSYQEDDDNIYIKPKIGPFGIIQGLKEEEDADTEVKRRLFASFETLKGDLERCKRTIESISVGEIIDWIGAKIRSHSRARGGFALTQVGGTVSLERTGILAELWDAMRDSPEPQTVKRGSPSYGLVSSDPDNKGSGEILDINLFEGARSGRVTFRCVDETIGSESFEVTIRFSEDSSLVAAGLNAFVNKLFASPIVGIKAATISRTITDEGDEAEHFSDWSISGESEANTDGGTIYCKYTSSSMLLELFNNSLRTNPYLVARGTWDGIDGSIVNLESQNNSGLSGSVKVSQVSGEDPQSSETLKVLLNPFKIGDKFYFDIIEDKSAFFQEFFWRMWTYELESSDTPTIPDGLANRGFG